MSEPPLQPPRQAISPATAAAIDFAYDLERRGRFEDAIDTLRAALAKQPGEAEIAWRLALMLLREGCFDEGWPLFERRPVNMGGRATGKPRLSFPEWDGGAIRSLLILPEQGLGDQIMFARYAPYLKAQGVDITIMCHPALARVFERLDVAVLSALGRVSLPRCDAWALGPSLPFLARAMPSQPYMRSAARNDGGIGLLAQGNRANPNDVLRSLPPDVAAELSGWPAVRNLDHTVTGARDLEDTARIIDGLDLVISVDTAVAHLAGAMGKPCWLLLPYVADWRWLRDRPDSVWYPTMRIFRQARPGDWASVVAELKAALAHRQAKAPQGAAGA